MVELYAQGVLRFGVNQAERYLEGLLAVFDLLATNPRMARERREFKPPVRLHPYRVHMIVYVERDQGILIIRVLSGRQDWERHLQ